MVGLNSDQFSSRRGTESLLDKRYHMHGVNKIQKNTASVENDDLRQTDHVTTPTRTRWTAQLASAICRATRLAADDVTVETYYCGN